MFPDWIFDQPCIEPGHELRLVGSSGSGGGRITRSSVRPGGAQGHMLEELGHSIFANCFRESNDHFGLHDDIFTMSIPEGGFDAGDISSTCVQLDNDDELERRPGVPEWIDCRDPEHYFLSFMKTYRKEGDVMRVSIAATTNVSWRARWQAQYDWLTNHWFMGVEYYRDPTAVDGHRETLGLQCLPGLCN
jgi:hypothetical protein